MCRLSENAYIRVRGMPERDIESLGVMGRWLDAARKLNSSIVAVAVVVALPSLCVYNTKAAITCYQKLSCPFLGESPCGSAAT